MRTAMKLIRVFAFSYMMLMPSCKRHIPQIRYSMEKSPKTVIGIDYKWFSYVKKEEKIILKDVFADSVSIYYMQENTPSIYEKQKIILWKKNKEQFHTDFDNLIRIYDNHFLLATKRKKTISIIEVIMKDKLFIKEFVKVDLEKVSCKEISEIKDIKMSGKEISIRYSIYDTCFDKDEINEVHFPLQF